MRTTNLLAKTTTELRFKHREWRIIPNTANTNWFNLEEIKTGKVLTHFVLYQSGDTRLLNRIACAPELEDIAEMYYATTIGEQAKKSAEKTTAHREWRIIRNTNRSGCFNLEDLGTGKVMGVFTLPESGDTEFLNCIACAPELEGIAKTFRNMMIGSRYEKSMVFSVVTEVLNRLQ